MCITINVPDTHIPVRIRGVEFLVVDQNLDEILLGHPFLRDIGLE